MPNICSMCGKKEMLPYKCKFCGWIYCSDHRLPENHECSGLEKLKNQTRESGRIVYQPVSEPIQKPKIGFPFGRRARSPYAVPVSRNFSLYIIMACVVMFFLQIFIRGFTEFFILYPPLALIRPWTFITYMFLHGGGSHLFFNMLVLFFFGPILERKIGTRNFLIVYFGAGILSALGQMAISFNPMLGASGAIFGVLAALTILDPNIRVYVYFIPMKIIHMLALFAFIDLYFLLVGSNDNIAHAAHLFGLLFGLYMGIRLKKEQSPYTW